MNKYSEETEKTVMVPINLMLDVFKVISASGLTATAIKIYLSLIERLAIRSKRSESITLDYYVNSLSISRNTASSAMQSLVDAGLIERKAVLRRGAPNRTLIQGPGLKIIDHMLGYPSLWRTGARPLPSAAPKAAPRHMTLGTALERKTQSHSAKNYWNTPQVKGGLPIELANGDKHAPPALPLSSHREDAEGIRASESHDRLRSENKNISSSELQTRGNRLDGFKFNLAASTSMSFKVGSQVIYEALQGNQLPILDEWNLTEEEKDHYIHLCIPRRHQIQVKRKKYETPKLSIKPDVRDALSPHIPFLRMLLSKDEMPKVIASIAFQIENKKIGRGSPMDGAQVAISLVRSGRYRVHKGMPSDWIHAAEAMLKDECNAQKIWH